LLKQPTYNEAKPLCSGISGPLNVVWGDGLHRIFSYPYAVGPFLVSYILANIGLVYGITFFHLIRKNNTSSTKSELVNLDKLFEKKKQIMVAGFSLILTGSLFELINIIRVGGITALFSGKAVFQSLSAGLTLTLPSTEIMIIGFSLVAIYLGVIHAKKYRDRYVKLRIGVFLLFSAPYILIKTILGQRSVLLTLLICFIIGFYYFKPIKKLKPKLVAVLLIAYVFLAFVFANRGIVSLIQDNPKQFIETAFQKERVVEALNPGVNEFGAAFGNYSEFYIKTGNDFGSRLGSTYIKGLVVPIPSFVYPGSKPKQITYEFRDELFASEASRGAIAGTGFSSILEAYMNFRYIGVILVYFAIGYLLQKIEHVLRYKSIFFILLYTASISQTMSFHRSAFGTIYSNIVLRAIILVPIVWYLNRYNGKKQKSISTNSPNQ
jgi:oligosaccharide repeat unit polymerase